MRPSSSSRLCAAAAAAWGLDAAIRYQHAGLSLAHYDARAHLVVARRVFDSLTPGWQQVGAVWLPLPHILNAVPVQIDWFYRTGYSGIAISIASMALAAWAIATLIHRATGSRTGGRVAAALLMLNPDVLYLQSTPMTEPLLFGTTFLAIALIGEWVARVQLPASGSRLPASGSQLPASGSQLPASGSKLPAGPPSRAANMTRFGGTAAPATTRAAGWACVAAVLTRYEAWPIVFAAIVLAFVALLRRGWPIAPAARAVRGLALWPLWALAAFLVNSKVSVGAWFISSGFFVAENPALGHLWLAWTQVWEGLVRLMGPVLPWLAVVSGLAIVAAFLPLAWLPPFLRLPWVPPFLRLPWLPPFLRLPWLPPFLRLPWLPPFLRLPWLPPSGGRKSEAGERADEGASRAAVILPLALVACAALPLFAYYRGHPLRIRYDVPLVAAAAALIGTAVALLPRRARAIAGVLVVALSAWQVRPFDPKAPVVVESQREAPNKLGRRAVTSYLEAHWNGRPILMSMGSLGHYMHDLSASGFAIEDFLHEGNGELWVHAARYPRPFVEWIAIEESAEGGDALHWQAVHDPNFLKGYVRVAEGGGVALFRRD